MAVLSLNLWYVVYCYYIALIVYILVKRVTLSSDQIMGLHIKLRGYVMWEGLKLNKSNE